MLIVALLFLGEHMKKILKQRILVMLSVMLSIASYMRADMQVAIPAELAKVLSFEVDGLGVAMTTNTPFKPFPKIPALSSIAISNIKVRIGNEPTTSPIYFYVSTEAYNSDMQARGSILPTITVSGNTTVLNVTLAVEFRLVWSASTGWVMALKGGLPGTWKVSSCIPALKGSMIDGLSFTSPMLVVSSGQYLDNDLQLMIPAGIGFCGQLNFTGPLAGLLTLVHLGAPSLSVYGTLGTLPKDFAIRASLGVPLNFPSSVASTFKSSDVMLEITGTPSIGLQTGLTVQVGSDTLLFDTRVGLGATAGNVNGSMTGSWKNPVGLNGITVDNVGMTLVMPYIEGGIPTGFGITGGIKMGKTYLSGGIELVDFFPTVLSVEADHTNLGDLLSLMKIKLSVPSLGLDKFKFVAVPGFSARKIGQVTFQPGFTIIFEIDAGKFGIDFSGSLNILPVPGLSIDASAGDKSKIEKEIKDSGSDLLSFNSNNNEILLASNDNTLLALSIGKTVDKAKDTVKDTAKNVSKDAQKAADAAKDAAKKLLDALQTITLNKFELVISLEEVKLNVQITYLKQKIGIDFDVDILTKGKNMFDDLANGIIDKLKKIV